ncbi:MAG: transketolase C-terminal domain-containing protein, partial [Planctomycetota bacterium]
GLVYAPLGPTHQAIEDIAIFRAIPHMTIVAPADASEMTRLMAATLDWPGPIYVRIAKGGDPVITKDDGPFVIGRGVPLREGKDALLVATGVMGKACLDAADGLQARGVSCGVLHLPTVKPLDAEAILARADGTRAVVSVEEHTVIGGLGSAVAEVLAEGGLSGARRFARMGIPDVFADRYGSQASLLARFGLTTEGISEKVLSLLSR